MIDLTSKTPEELNALIQKYAPVLQQVKVKPDQYQYIAYIIDIAINYLTINHKDLSADMKTWCIVVLKDLYMKNKINNDLDITTIIIDFINYYDLNYETYCSYMVSASDYDQQRGFVHDYVIKKGR